MLQNIVDDLRATKGKRISRNAVDYSILRDTRGREFVKSLYLTVPPQRTVYECVSCGREVTRICISDRCEKPSETNLVFHEC